MVRSGVRHHVLRPGGWGFSVYGCIILEDPKVVPGSNWEQLKTELTTKQGIDKPTVAMLATDSNSGKTAVQGTASAAQGAGFEVVYAKGVTRRRPRWSVTTPRTRRH